MSKKMTINRRSSRFFLVVMAVLTSTACASTPPEIPQTKFNVEIHTEFNKICEGILGPLSEEPEELAGCLEQRYTDKRDFEEREADRKHENGLQNKDYVGDLLTGSSILLIERAISSIF